MFGTVQPTPYDLNFQLIGIPVRVSPWFWLMGAILGNSALQQGIEYVLGWLVVIFVSIMVHEFGHALLAKHYGYRPRVLLYQFGGLAMFEPHSGYSRFRSITISFAGPLAGFVLFGIIFAFYFAAFPSIAQQLSDRGLALAEDVLLQFLYVNLVWGLINLLPVLPLDGGQISREICTWFSPSRGLLYAAWIAVFVGAGVAVLGILAGRPFTALLFGMLAFENFQATQRRWR